MPKIRSIHPDACESEKLLCLSDGAERTLWRLTTHSDDDGRGVDHPKLLANKLYPLDDTKTGDVINGHLDELVQAGMLVRYEVGGKRFYEVHDFTDWQKPKYKADSKLPAPDDGRTIPPSSPDQGANGTTPSLDVPHGDGGVTGVGDGAGGGEGSSSAPASVEEEPEFDAEVTDTARAVVQMIAANGHPLPTKGTKAAHTWLVEMDRLLRLGPPGQTTTDPPDVDDVLRVARWATSDPFWRSNIQSIPKLREKWSQLALKSRDGPDRRTNGAAAAASYAAAAQTLRERGE